MSASGPSGPQVKIIDTRISFYSRNTHLLPPEPKSSFYMLNEVSKIFI